MHVDHFQPVREGVRLHRCTEYFLLSSVWILLAASALLAQGTTARISGVVTDESNAVLPLVEVTVTNEETGAADRKSTRLNSSH